MAGGLQLIRGALALAVVLLGVTSAAGCRESPPSPPKAIVAESDPLIPAREAMARHDYGAAVVLLRDAVARRPTDLEAHYRLGVTATHLDRVEEAGQEFEWVVTHGAPGSAEVQLARDWLASRPQSAASVDAPPAGDEEQPVQRADLASLEGRASGPDKPLARLQLVLKGVPGSAIQDEYHILRTDPQGSFLFRNVVPGEYMLTTPVAAPVRWRLRVTLGRAERRVLELNPSNQLTARDDFPERQL